VREADGLALSSRNAYLSSDDRRAAPVLFRALRAAADAVVAGERDPRRLTARVREIVATEPSVELEYVEARDAASIAPIVNVEGRVLLALAARLGVTRLIDNVGIEIDGDTVTIDLGTISAGPIPVAP
jgi:pantoate--beta-alanine ligase